MTASMTRLRSLSPRSGVCGTAVAAGDTTDCSSGCGGVSSLLCAPESGGSCFAEVGEGEEGRGGGGEAWEDEERKRLVSPAWLSRKPNTPREANARTAPKRNVPGGGSSLSSI